jgi:hypothetical protein
MVLFRPFEDLLDRFKRDLARLVEVGPKTVTAAEVAVPSELDSDEKIVHQKTLEPGATGEMCAETGGPETGACPETTGIFSFILFSSGLTYFFFSLEVGRSRSSFFDGMGAA